PTWVPLTDRQLPSLAIKSLAISPVQPDVLFAGTGSTSSSFDVTPSIGVVRSLDGGTTWSVLASSTFQDQVINSIVPTALAGGTVVLAASQRQLQPPDFTRPPGGGVYRSTDAGVSFVNLSGMPSSSGLPAAGASALVGHPRDPLCYYAGVPGFGVYRSDD